MDRPHSAFRMEAAGSLTPALEGAPRSKIHPRTTKEKGRNTDEARKAKKPAVFLDQETETR